MFFPRLPTFKPIEEGGFDYKEANKDLSVQLNGTAFMRSFLCSGTHTQTHSLSSRYLLTALVRIVFTSLSTSSPLSTVYFKFHFIGRFISAKRMSVWLTMCMSLCLCVNVWFFRMKKKWTKKKHTSLEPVHCNVYGKHALWNMRERERSYEPKSVCGVAWEWVSEWALTCMCVLLKFIVWNDRT